MVPVETRRMTVEVDHDFVVFLVGMRINRLLRPDKWLPVLRAMPPMLAELKAQPELGLLHAEGHGGLRDFMVVQYWRSLEHLLAYAASRDHAHLPAWRHFNRTTSGNDAVGVWHETYPVTAGRYEALYDGMPRYGLGRVGRPVEAVGRRRTARDRLEPGAA